jgi:hypothetical protein
MKNYNLLYEKFGMPLDDKFGTKVGDTPGIKKTGAIGVRDNRMEGTVCSGCGELPVGGRCGCDSSDTCARCGMMPPSVDSPCSCKGSVSEAKGSCTECGMSESMCQCGMREAEKKGPTKSTLKKIFKGDKTFKDKVATVKKWGNIEDPEAYVGWAVKKMGKK